MLQRVRSGGRVASDRWRRRGAGESGGDERTALARRGPTVARRRSQTFRAVRQQQTSSHVSRKRVRERVSVRRSRAVDIIIVVVIFRDTHPYDINTISRTTGNNGIIINAAAVVASSVCRP